MTIAQFNERQCGIIGSTEFLGLPERHRGPNVNVTGVDDLTPSWWTLAIQYCVVVHVEWSVVHLD